MPPTLGAALLCSSRAGSDMWLLSRNSIVHRDWGSYCHDVTINTGYALKHNSLLEMARFEPWAAGSQSATLKATDLFRVNMSPFYRVNMMSKSGSINVMDATLAGIQQWWLSGLRSSSTIL